MSRRAILVIAAVLVAAVSTALLAIYVRGAEARADARDDLVGVLVAAESIDAGTTVDAAQAAGAFIEQARPEDDVPEGAFGDLAQLADLSDEQFTRGVVENEIILSSHLSETQASTLANPEQLAVTVVLEGSSGVGGQLMAGSMVMLFVTLNDGSGTRVLLPQVEVLSVDESGVTLAVDQQAAQELVHAQANGALYAAAIGSGFAPTNLLPTTNDSLGVQQ